ncbi:MAG: phytoene/squalene synthase family protein [Acidobacteriaceae bacterium]|nr:phytoene/squalene synthase family protein [Acidobacteriaceae bacterium]
MSSATAPALRTRSIEESYRYCRQIARTRAKNFYYSFLLLEKPRRDAMCAIYAFMRHCDDLSDAPGSSDKTGVRQSIAEWRLELDSALAGDVPTNPIWPAFHNTVQRYSIPHRFFHEMIDGITSDLDPRQIQTFEELYRYCYQVASVVGLVIVHIFGFESVKALLLAEKCGVAFQLTNILRDVREDAELGRVYLPYEDLEMFSVPFDQLRSGKEDNAFRDLMRFEAARTRAYYRESASLGNLVAPKSRRSLWALRSIYLNLLSRIEKANYAVLSRRINVPARTKIAILLRASVY